MALTILNNIPSLMAQNELAVTNQSLQSTLFQLASGSRINSGADDPAGLAIANGLQANIQALQQSTSNANDTIGALQVADGALGQITDLLDNAVTLATEAANSDLNTNQSTALNTEYQSIQSEINRIGSYTTYNGTAVFSTNALAAFMSDGSAAGTPASQVAVTPGALSSSSIGLSAYATGTLTAISNFGNGDVVQFAGPNSSGTTVTFAYTFSTSALTSGSAAGSVEVGASVAQSLEHLYEAINGVGSEGAGGDYISTASANSLVNATGLAGTTLTVTSEQSGTAGNNVDTTITKGASEAIAWGAGTLTGGAGSAADLTTSANAQTALTQIDAAISNVALLRGEVGAGINQLQAAVNVDNVQVQNITSAENDITAADIPTLVANLSKYSILEQTGISALAQANSNQQVVLKLLQ